jgi:hypothetical protein
MLCRLFACMLRLPKLVHDPTHFLNVIWTDSKQLWPYNGLSRHRRSHPCLGVRFELVDRRTCMNSPCISSSVSLRSAMYAQLELLLPRDCLQFQSTPEDHSQHTSPVKRKADDVASGCRRSFCVFVFTHTSFPEPSKLANMNPLVSPFYGMMQVRKEAKEADGMIFFLWLLSPHRLCFPPGKPVQTISLEPFQRIMLEVANHSSLTQCLDEYTSASTVRCAFSYRLTL